MGSLHGALGPHHLAPLSFLCGVALFAALMLLNALWDAAASRSPATRRRAERYPLPHLPLLEAQDQPSAQRQLPRAPWERAPRKPVPPTMAQVSPSIRVVRVLR